MASDMPVGTDRVLTEHLRRQGHAASLRDKSALPEVHTQADGHFRVKSTDLTGLAYSVSLDAPGPVTESSHAFRAARLETGETALSVQIWRCRRWLSVAVAAVAVVGPVASLASAGAVTKPAAPMSISDLTSPTEARRVDAVPTPKLTWRDCAVLADGAQCATVSLPLDYDQPRGAKTNVALLRHPARDQARRIGSLFLNPGGPGGSGTQLARGAPGFFGPAVLDRFDVVGFDPRGTNFSDQVKCFTSAAEQAKAYKGFNTVAVGKAEELAHIGSAKRLGTGCSSTGRPISASMSTAEVARDMDVLRRAVGDTQLTFLGFSYGSYLGQVYANMFPDRVRAVAIDGVVDPIAYAGTPATASQPQWDRLGSADGASKALRQILSLCDQAGEQKCKFAPGDPVANFELLADRLKETPLTLPGYPTKYSYAQLVSLTSLALYFPGGYAMLDLDLSELMILTEPAGSKRVTPAERLKVGNAFVARLKALEAALGDGLGLEPLLSVSCTDGVSPPDASSRQLIAAAAAAENRAKHFGGHWARLSTACGSKTWTARDEDAYRGPFNRRTASPVLVVGSKWDPATNYQGAVKAASLLPNSRLLSSDNWGHGAYLTSQCATSAIETYLLDQALPAPGTYCHGDVQPFRDSPISELRTVTPRGQRAQAPVVPLFTPRS
jgi:pimeloyl-ACP methyl ester carboxylesterase